MYSLKHDNYHSYSQIFVINLFENNQDEKLNFINITNINEFTGSEY